MKKGKKIELSDQKTLFFSGIFPSGMGDTPPPPLTENHCAQKSLAERGVPPPPLKEKIC